ncbi:patatin-like phospholipase family protein [Amnimonas aquatica]|uniref:Patatin n=1 Tax=Amnimonas aquatica TaxID=2094561 RepID=A0A2P6AU14_9GAMM|nr:patatin-like phospholipase family protein [Amnimonas aquatica]PQA48950.1 Patatin [Amnimonas aquatica]
MQAPASPLPGATALVLSGGGARAAYQVGVLQAIADMMPPACGNPFPIICGTSAGALNAANLAVHAACFQEGVEHLREVWSNFDSSQVYRTDWPGVLSSAIRWLSNLSLGLFNKTAPVSLLDNQPLAALLTRSLDLQRLPASIQAGHLRALCITACSYTRGDSVSFYQGDSDLEDWGRARRRGHRCELGINHLMASSAIPLLFPAVELDGEYYGDGALRQLAPVSPALHLGARRILVIGSGASGGSQGRRMTSGYPSLAQIIGHIMSSSFVDSLEMDLERLHRINQTVSLLPSEASTLLRPVQYMVLAPPISRIEELAARYAHTLPRSIRFFVRGSGMFKRAGSNLLSYLLFEAPYAQALMDLGYADAQAREVELREFLRPDLAPPSNVVAFRKAD